MTLESAITDLAAALREVAEALRGRQEAEWTTIAVSEPVQSSPVRPGNRGPRGLSNEKGESLVAPGNGHATEAVETSGTELPDRWVQNFAHAELAEKRRLSLQDEADAFRETCKREGRRSEDWNAEFTAWLTGTRRQVQRAVPPPQAATPATEAGDAADFELCQQARAGKFGKKIQARAEGGARPEVIRGMVMDREEQAAKRKAKANGG